MSRHQIAIHIGAHADGVVLKLHVDNFHVYKPICLVNMTRRFMDPRLGRFLTPDPIVFKPSFGQSWNPFAYVDGTKMGVVGAINSLNPLYAIAKGALETYGAAQRGDFEAAGEKGVVTAIVTAVTVVGVIQGLSSLGGKPPPTGVGAAEGAAEAGAARSGTYGQLRNANVTDAHHIIQDAAVRNLPGYSRSTAPAVELPGPSTRIGSPHHSATQVQRQAGGGTYAAERRIGYKALRRAGIPESEARRLIQVADEHFNSIGVGPTTPTRIPGNR